MPTPTVKKRAEEYGVKVSTIESIWKKAKEVAKDEGKGNNWSYIESIFESMVKSHMKKKGIKKKSSSLVFSL